MTNEQLAEFIQSGDSDELIPVLWEKIKPLIYMKCDSIYTAKPDYFKQCGVEVWDMKQACYSAYLAAVKYYKPESGYKFTTFLVKPMQTAISELTDCKTSKKNVLNESLSLDKTITSEDGEETSYMDLVADPQGNEFIDNLEQEAEAASIWEAVNSLEEKYSAVLIAYFKDNRPLKEIAQDMNISPQSVRDIQQRALSRLKRNKYICGLRKEYVSHKCWNNISKFEFRPDYFDTIRQYKERMRVSTF